MQLLSLLIIFFTNLIPSSSQESSTRTFPKQERCLGLVLKGGANRGSYEAGAISALVKNLPSDQVKYDVVSGVSVGAMNAGHVAAYPIGQELEMSEDLIALWMNLSQGNLYKNWKWGGVFNGLLFKQGLYDSSPLHEFITEYFQNRSIHRLVHFNSVDANSGEIVTFDETCDKETFIKGLCASTAVPFLFPPVKIGDRVLMDGGVAWNLDVASAIQKCRLLVDSYDKITLDVIDVDRSFGNLEPWNYTGNAISNFMRHDQIKNYFDRIDDLREIQLAYPQVEYRYLIIPQVQLDPMYRELDLNQELVRKLIEMGYQDALDAIDNYMLIK